jgi:hypothetical protein
MERRPRHAARLEIRHPAGHLLTIEAPIPSDLCAALAALRG